MLTFRVRFALKYVQEYIGFLKFVTVTLKMQSKIYALPVYGPFSLIWLLDTVHIMQCSVVKVLQ
jgi:hypothetical protein